MSGVTASAILPALTLTALHVLVVHVVDGAPVQSTSLALTNNSPPPGECMADDVYWDTEEERCKVCVKCAVGSGSSASKCGYGDGEKGQCVECMAGDTYMYQDQPSTHGPCKPCTQCDPNAIVTYNCTSTTNTVCGPCKPGYGPHPNFPSLCSRCIDFNEDERPQECLSTPAPFIATSPPFIATSPPTPTVHDLLPILTQSPTMPTTRDGEGTTTSKTYAVSDAPMAATSPNSTTTADSGALALPVGLVVSVVVVVVGVLVLLLYLYKRRRDSRQSKGRSSITNEDGTQQERDALADGTDTAVDAQENGEPQITINQDTVQYSAVPTNGIVPSDPDETISNGAPPGSPEVPPIFSTVHGSPPTQCTDSLNDSSEGLPTTQPSTEEEYTTTSDGSASQPAPDSTDGDAAPNGIPVVPTIPENSNHDQSEASRPHYIRQDSNKRNRIIEQKHRPLFKRSVSEPVGNSQKKTHNDANPLALSGRVRAACNKNEKNTKRDEFCKKYEKACSLGRDMQWKDLSNTVRKTVRNMLTRDNKSNINISNYIDLGEVLGLDRRLDLKTCDNADDMFALLDTSQDVPTNVEVILQKLKEIIRLDVVRELVDGILTEEGENNSTL